MTHTSAESRAVLQSYLDALVAGDLDRIADSFTEDATWSLHGTLPLSGVRRGRHDILEFLTSAGALYETGTQQFTFADITAENDRAVLEWQVTGIASATGKQYANEYCGVFVIRDGRIAEVREYLDSLHVAETLFPTPA
ncbi:MAG TPA: nuclear transport factor 2 family protein [Jatrophihabitantaceae bacterium]|nr:nuclear transport factor 2 family protein [Jatrophihabitantaceae bacterium]